MSATRGHNKDSGASAMRERLLLTCDARFLYLAADYAEDSILQAEKSGKENISELYQK